MSVETHIKSRQIINTIMEDTQLCDTWRNRHPEKHHSWFRYNPFPSFSRTDYFLVSNSLYHIIHSCKYTPGISSDHSFVELILNKFSMKRGPGFWKFNTSLLDSPEYTFKINHVFDQASKNYSESTDNIRWDLMKCDIISVTKDFACRNANKQKSNMYARCEKLETSQSMVIAATKILFTYGS